MEIHRAVYLYSPFQRRNFNFRKSYLFTGNDTLNFIDGENCIVKISRFTRVHFFFRGNFAHRVNYFFFQNRNQVYGWIESEPLQERYGT